MLESKENSLSQQLNSIANIDQEIQKKFNLDFSIETIKKNYIYPFNQTLKRSKFNQIDFFD